MSEGEDTNKEILNRIGAKYGVQLDEDEDGSGSEESGEDSSSDGEKKI